jgi:hypothetical protein
MPSKTNHNSEDVNEASGQVAKDSVCVMKVNKKTATKLTYQENQNFYIT